MREREKRHERVREVVARQDASSEQKRQRRMDMDVADADKQKRLQQKFSDSMKDRGLLK